MASVRSEKESLDGRISELTISHKMLCSENARLNNELEAAQRLIQVLCQLLSFQKSWKCTCSLSYASVLLFPLGTNQ